MLRIKKKQAHINRQFGFTMVELLVVMFVISLLAALSLAGYHNGQKRYVLSQDSQRLMASLRKVQNMAMSGVDIEGQYCGYGIFVDKNDNLYIIYGDKVPANCGNTNNKYDASDEIIETINLTQGIVFEDITPLPPKLDIFFKPPNPTTYINGKDTVGVSGTVTLGREDTSLTKIITVTTAGLIQGN